MKNTDFVVRFAGEGGQGFLSAAIGFASANTKAGYHAQTFATFPSQITGGPTWMQTRISIDPVLSRGDEVDVLVSSEDEESSHEEPSSDLAQESIRPSVNAKKAEM